MHAGYILIPLLLSSFWSRLPAEWDSLVWDIRLDGVNAIRYEHEYPLRSCDFFGLTRFYADPSSRLIERLNGLSDTTRSWSMVLSGMAGSETGDPLLNSYLNPRLGNRDHETRSLIAVQKGLVGIGCIREYNDLYSRRLDSLWNESLPGSENLSYGLLTEDAAAANIRFSRVSWTGSLAHYRRWQMTPLFYTPVFSKGISSTHQAVIRTNTGQINVKGGIDLKDRFETLLQPERRNYTWIIAQGSQRLADSLSAAVRVERWSEKAPHSHAALTFDWRTSVVSFLPWCGMYENGRSFAGVKATVPVLPGAGIEGTVEECYEPAGESVSFIRSDDTVRYRPEDAAYGAAHLAGRYGKSAGKFTVSARTWFDYASAARIEAWDTASYRNIQATCTIFNQDVYSGGTALTSFIRHGQWSVSLIAAGHTLFNNSIQSLYLPWNWRMGVHYGNPESDSITASIVCEGSGPAEATQLKAGVIQMERSEHREAVSFSITIPFYLPFACNRLTTTFHLNAGPFCLAPRVETPQHPFGNPIGPVIAIKFDCSLNGR